MKKRFILVGIVQRNHKELEGINLEKMQEGIHTFGKALSLITKI
jgi:hypothetical protein